MAFHWHGSSGIAIDSLADAVMDELIVNGGWTNTDDGYCVTDPSARFDLAVTIEATNKRYIQFEVADAGTFNTGTHSMDAPKISWGHIFIDAASANGTDECTLKMSYDNNHAIIMADFKPNGATYRRCLTYCGLLDPFDTSDECITGGSTLFRENTPTPTNDEDTRGEIRLLDDISHAANKPAYCSCGIVPVGALAVSDMQPKIQIQSAVINKRSLIPCYLTSNSALPAANGEDAGIRAQFYNMYVGGYYDSATHGQVVEASDGKEYYYYEQADDFAYANMPCALLVRKS